MSKVSETPSARKSAIDPIEASREVLAQWEEDKFINSTCVCDDPSYGPSACIYCENLDAEYFQWCEQLDRDRRRAGDFEDLRDDGEWPPAHYSDEPPQLPDEFDYTPGGGPPSGVDGVSEDDRRWYCQQTYTYGDDDVPDEIEMNTVSAIRHFKDHLDPSPHNPYRGR